jgi:hypothetical protein
MLARTALEADKLNENMAQFGGLLKDGQYAPALDQIADLQRRLGHIGTTLIIVRDWQEAIAAQDQAENQRKEKHGRKEKANLSRSARAGSPGV